MAADGLALLRALLALCFVLGLVAGAAWLSRRFLPGWMAPRLGGKQRRLRVTETLPLDNRRRLLLIRCDDQEFLLLTGGSADLLVASVSGAPAPAQPEQSASLLSDSAGASAAVPAAGGASIIRRTP